MNVIVKIREFVRLVVINLQMSYLKLYGMHIAKSARISFGAKLDKTYPQGIHIGDESYVASGAIILSHDYCKSKHVDTFIGKQCFIGSNAIIIGGAKIGDNCVVGAGAIVTKDVPSGCIVAGNPARIIRQNIVTGKFGKIL